MNLKNAQEPAIVSKRYPHLCSSLYLLFDVTFVILQYVVYQGEQHRNPLADTASQHSPISVPRLHGIYNGLSRSCLLFSNGVPSRLKRLVRIPYLLLRIHLWLLRFQCGVELREASAAARTLLAWLARHRRSSDYGDSISFACAKCAEVCRSVKSQEDGT